MVLQWKGFQRCDGLRTAEFGNQKVAYDFSKEFSIEVKVPTLQYIEFAFLEDLLLSKVKYQAFRLLGVDAGGVNHSIWGKESPKKVEGHFATFEKFG